MAGASAERSSSAASGRRYRRRTHFGLTPDGKGGQVVHVEGEILACKPGELLQLTHRAGAVWRRGPKIFSSRLAYRIHGLGFATKLSVVHDQWEEGDPGHAHNSEGWPLFLSSVKSYLETGKPLTLPMG